MNSTAMFGKNGELIPLLRNPLRASGDNPVPISSVKEQIEFYCAICGSGLRAASHLAGARVKCPRCAGLAPVPIDAQTPLNNDLSEVFPAQLLTVEIRFSCGACHHKLQIEARCEGTTLNCPICGALTNVPTWSGHAAECLSDCAETLTPEEVQFLSGFLDGKTDDRDASQAHVVPPTVCWGHFQP